MRTIKGSAADKAGIKYEPNTDSSTFSSGFKIFLDLEDEILDSGKTENPEAEYLKKIEEVELKEKNTNYRIKLMPDVIESD